MSCEICIPITATNVEHATEDIKLAEKLSNLIELRIDCIKDIDREKLKKLLENKTKKAIVTCRPKNLCGKFENSEKERINLLKHALELNAEFIDIEIESDKKKLVPIIKNKKNARIIVSYHNFRETPPLEELNKKYNEIKKFKPDLIKVVTNANSINDNFTIFRLLEGKKDLIAFCMGIRGHISRILAPKYRSAMTFASLKEGKESASGQISIEEMKNTYNLDLLNPSTGILGVIGEFAENSMSKYMHNTSFKAKKLNFVYMPFKVREEELGSFMKNFREFGFRGSSVTIPHKIGITKYLDEIDGTAEEIGAANTIINKNGMLIGYNTDYYGAVEALKEKTPIKGKKILVIGAGGASRAIIYGLKKEGAKITLINRTGEKAKNLADEFGVERDSFDNKKTLVKNADIVINATSTGMEPNTNESIINENDLARGKIIMDIVYKPAKTKLIKAARKIGCKTVTGDRMLLYQAIGQFKLWTGQQPDFRLMENSLLKQIQKE